MAQYEIIYACGHKGTVDLYGPRKQREWKISQLEQDDCPECEEKYAAERRAAIRKENLEAGLPELTGSEKQIAWAEEIRKDWRNKIDDIVNMSQAMLESRASKGKDTSVQEGNLADAEIACEVYLGQTQAGWIISHRSDNLLLESRKIRESQPEKKAEKIFKPDNEYGSEPVFVELDTKRTGWINVWYPKDDRFMRFVKARDARWGDCWSIPWQAHYSSSIKDMMACIASELLAEGFAVKLADEEAIRLLETEAFTPRADKIICAPRGYENRLYIVGANGEAEDAALKIKGATEIRDKISVPAYQYETVLEFADIYNFKISDGAQKRIQAQAELEKVRLNGSKKKLAQPAGSVSDILKSSTEVIEDLKDED